MDQLKVSRRFALALVPVIGGILVGGAVIGFGSGLSAFVREGGALERSQEFVLLATAVVFVLTAIRSAGEAGVAAVTGVFFCVVCFFRELELPVTGFVTGYINSDAFRWHEAGLVTAILVPYLYLKRHFIPKLFRSLIKGDFWPLFLSAGCLLAAEFFDKHGADLAALCLEEFLEMGGYITLLLLAGAFASGWGLGRPRPGMPVDEIDAHPTVL